VTADLLLRQCASILAQVESLKLQVESLKAWAEQEHAKVSHRERVELALLPECKGVSEDRCGLRCEDAWIDRSSLKERKRSCRGCGYVEGT
jgi:hypothetical protein